MGISWTDEQKSVINSRHGNLLVSAAAGSGKTAVLVERILEMVMGIDADGRKTEAKIDIDEVLVVTFTRAAAAQMKEKIADKLEQAAEEHPEDEHIVKQLSLLPRADIMTIDSFCLGIVKDYFQMIGIDSSFDIADNAEMDLIKNDILDEVLEQKYQEASDEFIGLVDSFARKESDEKIRELVYQIYRVASGYPKPERWINEAETALEVSTKEELYTLKWYRDYMQIVADTLDSAIGQAEQCLEIAGEADGPAGYDPIIRLDLELLRNLRQAEDMDEAYKRVSKFSNLKRIAACDPEKQQYVKTTMQTYRGSVKDMMALFRPTGVILAECAMMKGPLSALLSLTRSYMERLKEEKLDRNLYEFRDISEFAYDILCAGTDENGCVIPSEAGKTVARRYREILIDEYQDSNFLQEDILNCVTGHGEDRKNMFMVGDIKQSIYRFRMARPDLFLNKYNTYSDLEDAEDQKILLSNNFRSAGKVIDTINQIFEPLMSENLGGIDYDESAKLHIGRQDKNNMGYGSEILIVRNDCADPEKSQPEEIRSLTNVDIEARMIADEIYELVKGDKPLYIPDGDNGETRRVSYRDIAILMRSVKKNAKAFEEAFAERGIPLFVESESGYFDAIEISTLLDMLAVIDNSHQDYALAAVLRSPLAGVKEQELAEIVGIYDRDFKDHEKNLARTASFYQKVCYYAEKPDSEASEELRQFLRMLDSWKADKNYMSISELLHSILEQTGYYWFVGAMQSGKRRQANIDMLIQKADTYEDSSFRGLFNFLRYMDRLKTNDLDFAEASVLGDDDDSVVMMTMHKSKGLEFPVVFVSGLANRFSNLDALSPVTVNADSYLAGYAIDRKNRAKKKTFARAAMLSVMNAEKLAEEIRILYVALSRAKEKLYMTAAVKDPGAEKAVFDYPLQTDFLIEASGQMRMELPYITRMEAGCFMDWILSALSMHIVSEDIVCRKDTYATWVLAKTGYQNQILAGTKTDMSEENAVQTENETENKSKSMIAQEDRQLYEKYKELLDYTYPYKTEQAVKNKMSVTEIKRLAHRGEENPGSDLYQPPVTEAELTIPVLHSRMKEEPVKGNEMGTVIHKIMELIDFTRNSMDEIREQIRSFFDHGYLEERYREHVRADKIYNMVNSPLGIRMAEAQKNHTLYREQQFYIGMKPEDISPEYKDSKDMVVVQGVIDAYFLEGDQVVLMDYKTDRVNQISDLVSRYHVQLDMYAKTIHQLTGRMVTEKIIYAFHFDDSINL